MPSTPSHCLAVDELPLTKPPSGIDDPWIAIRPVVAVRGEQPDAFAVPLDDHAEAIVFVQPIRANWHLRPAVAGLNFEIMPPIFAVG